MEAEVDCIDETISFRRRTCEASSWLIRTSDIQFNHQGVQRGRIVPCGRLITLAYNFSLKCNSLIGYCIGELPLKGILHQVISLQIQYFECFYDFELIVIIKHYINSKCLDGFMYVYLFENFYAREYLDI